MIVISSAELRNNMKKYLDLAMIEKVVIQRGRTDVFVLSLEKKLNHDEDLVRGISAEELLVGIEEDIRKLFREKYNK